MKARIWTIVALALLFSLGLAPSATAADPTTGYQSVSKGTCELRGEKYPCVKMVKGEEEYLGFVDRLGIFLIVHLNRDGTQVVVWVRKRVPV